jgi:Fe-Mn family superoxide dismutase
MASVSVAIPPQERRFQYLKTKHMDRRDFLNTGGKITLGSVGLAAGLSALQSCGSSQKSTSTVSLYPGTPGFTQQGLAYDYRALEPAIDAMTMEIHYTRHASGYTKNMNDALKEEFPKAQSMEEVFAQMSKFSAKLRNNAGGHYNHESYWKWMTPRGSTMSPALRQAIETAFVSVSDLKNRFTDAATKRFGSGWAWLVVDAQKKLSIGSTPNQDNPLMDNAEFKGYPLLGVDVWEHAYYLRYQNKRADYLNAWWDLVNWAEVEARYNFAMK